MAWTGLGSGHTAYLAVTAWASGCNCGHWARWRRWSAAGWSTCDPPKQRALFGLLLSRVDRPVSVDALLEEFWSGDPPAAATASLQAYVSNLRRVLEPHRPPLITAALGAMGESNWYPVSYGVVDEGLVNVLGRALARLADPTQRALALSCLAAARYYDGRPQRRAAQSDEALTLARGLTDDLAWRTCCACGRWHCALPTTPCSAGLLHRRSRAGARRSGRCTGRPRDRRRDRRSDGCAALVGLSR